MNIKKLITIMLMLTCGCAKEEADVTKHVTTHKNNILTCDGKPVKKLVVAVIDTGFGYNGLGDLNILCKSGHKDFSNDKKFVNSNIVSNVPLDTQGHGTNIAGTIAKYASVGKWPFCIVILKYYNPNNSGMENINNTINAILYAKQIHADFVNYSGGGLVWDQNEAAAVRQYLDDGGTFVAAAGNDHKELTAQIKTIEEHKEEEIDIRNELNFAVQHKDYDRFSEVLKKSNQVGFYPAMDDKRVISVGNIDPNGKIASTSNYGEKITRWEIGQQTVYGISLQGTSQSTAVATGKIISSKKCKISVDRISK